MSILLKLKKGNKWTNKDIYLRGQSKIECLGEKKAMSYAFKLNLTTPQQGLDKDRALWSRDRDRPLYDSVLLSGNLTIVLGFVVRVEGFQEDDGIYLWIVICDSRRRFFCVIRTKTMTSFYINCSRWFKKKGFCSIQEKDDGRDSRKDGERVSFAQSVWRGRDEGFMWIRAKGLEKKTYCLCVMQLGYSLICVIQFNIWFLYLFVQEIIFFLSIKKNSNIYIGLNICDEFVER
jgi:hypothetical protein